MAALSHPRLRVRAAMHGEGVQVAALWRELWEVHEQWGGYLGSRDPLVYAELAARLDEDARLRSGHAVLGQHVHLVAEVGGSLSGQVEGWLERYGCDVSTPLTCEVRSLIVREGARGGGVGRALLEALARVARNAWRKGPGLLAAEVLTPNPATAFYERVGYRAVSHCARIEATGADVRGTPFVARLAESGDEIAVLGLEENLAARRRVAGDLRFDGPRPPASAPFRPVLALSACHAGKGTLQDPATLVAVDRPGAVVATASFTVHTLDPPFVPVSRALLGRFAFAEGLPAEPLVIALLALARRLATARSARHIELTDLSPPGTDLYDSMLSCGARPWSRLVTRGLGS